MDENGSATAPRGFFITLEGTDGSGKSTLSKVVARALTDLAVEHCSNKVIATEPDFVNRSMTAVAQLLWPKESTLFDHLLPLHYWLHLQVTWYTLFCEFVVRPQLNAGKILIIDGWYYKFVAKLLVRGISNEYLATVFSNIQQPDAVIFLDVDVEAIWDRKNDFRPHEMGLHHRYPELGRESFLDYQTKILDALRSLATNNGWHTAHVDGTASLEQNTRLISEIVERLDFVRRRQTASAHR
jgi:dTMP kinase